MFITFKWKSILYDWSMICETDCSRFIFKRFSIIFFELIESNKGTSWIQVIFLILNERSVIKSLSCFIVAFYEPSPWSLFKEVVHYCIRHFISSSCGVLSLLSWDLLNKLFFFCSEWGSAWICNFVARQLVHFCFNSVDFIFIS